MSWNGTVTCSYCYQDNHNRRSCEKLKKHVEENPDSWRASEYKLSKERGKARTCSYCKTSGHNRKTCGARKSDIYRATKVNKEWCSRLVDYLNSAGLTIGSLVTCPEPGWGNEEKESLGVVTGFNWTGANFMSATDSYSGDFVQVRFVTELATSRTRDHRLPVDNNGLQENDDGRYGRPSLLNVCGQIHEEDVIKAQLPNDFTSGRYGIEGLFQEDRYSAPITAIEAMEQKYF